MTNKQFAKHLEKRIQKFAAQVVLLSQKLNILPRDDGLENNSPPLELRLGPITLKPIGLAEPALERSEGS